MTDYFAGVSRMAWWRADRYEIRELRLTQEADAAYFIVPAEDAQWRELDPWEETESTHPLLSLMQLISKIRHDPLPADDPLRGFHPAIETWVSKNGLLGLLHQRVREVTLSPRQGSLPSRPTTREFSSTRYIRGGGGWLEDLQGPPTLKNSIAGPPSGSYGRRTPEVVIERLFGERGAARGFHREPLSTTWTSYFPRIPSSDREGFPYPSPDSVEFFQCYAEPLGEFLRFGSLLLDSVEALSAERPFDMKDFPEDEERTEELERSWSSLGFLNSLSQSAELIAVWESDGTVRQAWWTPSLLGAIAVMALNEVAGGLPPRICAIDGCGEVFKPVKRSARYHSAQCKGRQKKRKQRARARTRAQGQE